MKRFAAAPAGPPLNTFFSSIDARTTVMQFPPLLTSKSFVWIELSVF